MDPTVVAIPGYFATMGAEAWYLKRRAATDGPSAADYTRDDTITSLAMGVASLVTPLVMPKLVAPLTPGKGRYGKALVATAVGAVAITTVADVVSRLDPDDASATVASTELAEADGSESRDRAIATAPMRKRTWKATAVRAARAVAGVGGVVSVATSGVALTTWWSSRSTTDRLWRHRLLPDLGAGVLGWTVAIVGWDFIYYWNHRFMHESRFMWAIHVVHHSSERYNLSTALRQPVADVLGTFAPYGALALFGVRPDLILQARGWNLLYQYWIHTDTIRSLGPLDSVLNTPSLHRVHHGTNRKYIDRNHGSILIIWDRLFGTYQREEEPVVYGLTTNIDTYNPLRVATHEHRDMLDDVRHARTWRERLSYVLRGPGWAIEHRKARLAAAGDPPELPARAA